MGERKVLFLHGNSAFWAENNVARGLNLRKITDGRA